MAFSFLFLVWIQNCFAIEFKGIVASSTIAIFSDVSYDYSVVQPDTKLSFVGGTGASTFLGVASGNYTYAVSSEPPDLFGLPDSIRFFPFGAVAFITPVNIPSLPSTTNLSFTRDTLARIFAGNVTMWNDKAITDTNPNVSMPNQSIQVVFRSGSSGSSELVTRSFSYFSPAWTYGSTDLFPANITQNNSRYWGVSSSLKMFAKLLDLSYSIGYISISQLSHQNAPLIIPEIINKAGHSVAPNTANMQAAMRSVVLNAHELPEFLDSDLPNAWPMGHFMYMAVSNNFTQRKCTEARDFYKFLNYMWNFEIPRNLLIESLTLPLSASQTQEANQLGLNDLLCEGVSVLQPDLLPTQIGPGLTFLLVVDAVMIVVIVVLTAINLQYFRTPIINVLYTAIFATGSLILFAAPPFFAATPSPAVCGARVWLTSLGFSLILGTMFSRTWQLREIYLLQRKKFDNFKDLSVSSSLRKLTTSMTIVTIIIFTFLGLWTGIDPFRPKQVISDPLNLVEELICSSNYFGRWLAGLGGLILIFIVFGIYVIYQTWSFQRTVLLAETKWVLLALYNILLNLVAIVPTLIFQSSLSQLNLALLLCTTIIFSGSGIIFAVMLPRVVSKLEWSDASHSGEKNKPTTNGTTHLATKQTTERFTQKIPPGVTHEEDDPLHPRPTNTKTKTKKERGSVMNSRTPEAELIARLEAPQRLMLNNNGNGLESASSHCQGFLYPNPHESPLSGRESPHSRDEERDQSVVELQNLNPLESPSQYKAGMIDLSSSQAEQTVQ